uniref:Uncharacterized protein n=1 Tax=Anguilla anguilla TaxID=7936 RepID=A0A0E9QRY4_ANGAN
MRFGPSSHLNPGKMARPVMPTPQSGLNTRPVGPSAH